jgi:hypothetical protein
VPELDLEQFFLVDAPARVRAFLDENALPLITTADTLPDAMDSASDVPSLFGIHGRMPNQMVNGRRRLVAGHRKKLYKFMPVFAVVTESYASNFKEDGRAGGWTLMQQIANIFDGWLAPGMNRAFDVVDMQFVIRSADLTRVQHQIVLEGGAELFTTPALVAP